MVCTTFTIIATFGYYRIQIMVVVERECSKPAKNRQTLITNCLQEKLVLTQKHTKNDENIKIFGKTSLLTLTNDLFVFDILNAFLASAYIFVQIRKDLRWRDVKTFLQNGSVTWKSQVDWPLTFCLKEQYAASVCRSRFQTWSKKLKYWRL